MIELRNVGKTFAAPDGPVEVLKDVSLSIRRGEIFGVIGRSGAGKSTLVRCVNALERPTTGAVFVGGVEISALDGAALRAARRGVGMIFQHFNLLSSRTVFDNVALPLEIAGESRAKIKATVGPLLELVGLADRADRHPAQLSGGQKQRVGIARALALNPQVLLCDEATSALDPETTQSILTLLRDVNRKLGPTVVLITHEMNVAKELCDRLAVMEQGRVAELGDAFDVFTDPRSEAARTLVREVLNHDLPPEVARRLRPGHPPGTDPVVRVTFTGPSAATPVVTELVRDVGVGVNLLHGRIDYIQGRPYGVLTAELSGDAERIAAAYVRLRGKNLKLEELGHVVGDD